jgi:hypothetical protein
LGIGDWAQSPIPNPQSPIPNPQSPLKFKNIKKSVIYLNNYYLKKIYLFKSIKRRNFDNDSISESVKKINNLDR